MSALSIGAFNLNLNLFTWGKDLTWDRKLTCCLGQSHSEESTDVVDSLEAVRTKLLSVDRTVNWNLNFTFDLLLVAINNRDQNVSNSALKSFNSLASEVSGWGKIAWQRQTEVISDFACRSHTIIELSDR